MFYNKNFNAIRFSSSVFLLSSLLFCEKLINLESFFQTNSQIELYSEKFLESEIYKICSEKSKNRITKLVFKKKLEAFKNKVKSGSSHVSHFDKDKKCSHCNCKKSLEGKKKDEILTELDKFRTQIDNKIHENYREELSKEIDLLELQLFGEIRNPIKQKALKEDTQKGDDINPSDPKQSNSNPFNKIEINAVISEPELISSNNTNEINNVSEKGKAGGEGNDSGKGKKGGGKSLPQDAVNIKGIGGKGSNQGPSITPDAPDNTPTNTSKGATGLPVTKGKGKGVAVPPPSGKGESAKGKGKGGSSTNEDEDNQTTSEAIAKLLRSNNQKVVLFVNKFLLGDSEISINKIIKNQKEVLFGRRTTAEKSKTENAHMNLSEETKAKAIAALEDIDVKKATAYMLESKNQDVPAQIKSIMTRFDFLGRDMDKIVEKLDSIKRLRAAKKNKKSEYIEGIKLAEENIKTIVQNTISRIKKNKTDKPEKRIEADSREDIDKIAGLFLFLYDMFGLDKNMIQKMLIKKENDYKDILYKSIKDKLVEKLKDLLKKNSYGEFRDVFLYNIVIFEKLKKLKNDKTIQIPSSFYGLLKGVRGAIHEYIKEQNETIPVKSYSGKTDNAVPLLKLEELELSKKGKKAKRKDGIEIIVNDLLNLLINESIANNSDSVKSKAITFVLSCLLTKDKLASIVDLEKYKPKPSVLQNNYFIDSMIDIISFFNNKDREEYCFILDSISSFLSKKIDLSKSKYRKIFDSFLGRINSHEINEVKNATAENIKQAFEVIPPNIKLDEFLARLFTRCEDFSKDLSSKQFKRLEGYKPEDLKNNQISLKKKDPSVPLSKLLEENSKEIDNLASLVNALKDVDIKLGAFNDEVKKELPKIGLKLEGDRLVIEKSLDELIQERWKTIEDKWNQENQLSSEDEDSIADPSEVSESETSDSDSDSEDDLQSETGTISVDGEEDMPVNIDHDNIDDDKIKILEEIENPQTEDMPIQEEESNNVELSSLERANEATLQTEEHISPLAIIQNPHPHNMQNSLGEEAQGVFKELDSKNPRNLMRNNDIENKSEEVNAHNFDNRINSDENFPLNNLAHSETKESTETPVIKGRRANIESNKENQQPKSNF